MGSQGVSIAHVDALLIELPRPGAVLCAVGNVRIRPIPRCRQFAGGICLAEEKARSRFSAALTGQAQPEDRIGARLKRQFDRRAAGEKHNDPLSRSLLSKNCLRQRQLIRRKGHIRPITALRFRQIGQPEVE